MNAPRSGGRSASAGDCRMRASWAWWVTPVRSIPAAPCDRRSIVRSGISSSRRESSSRAPAATSTLVAVTGLVTVLAASAGLLSAIGLYLVIAFVVRERRRSTAIRIALGATAGRVVWENFLTSAGVLAVALPLGTIAALLASHALDDLVYGVG